MGAHIYKPEFCATATEILSRGKSLAAVCAALKVTRQSLYNWKDSHPEFRVALDEGMQACQAYWEDMGENGIVGNYEKFSSAPWIFSMKNRFRADYQEDKEPKSVNDTIVEKLLDRLVE